MFQSCKINIFIVSNCVFPILLYWNSMKNTCQNNLQGAWKWREHGHTTCLMPHNCGNIRTLNANAKRQWLILSSAQYNQKVVERYLTACNNACNNACNIDVFNLVLKCIKLRDNLLSQNTWRNSGKFPPEHWARKYSLTIKRK